MLLLFVGPIGVYLLDFFCSGIQFYSLFSPYFCFISLLYTQTKKIRPIFMVLYLLIQIRCLSKKYTKMFIKHPTHKSW